ncbi:urease accessory protein UreE [Mycolicibacterium sp. S3B2]|uniref:urease accessory protein UreE n=1 Tax=Mycolicibacterium sp. S3B2 TaxID=3415120 RepID=UPI003C79C0F3
MKSQAIIGDVAERRFDERRRHYVDIGWGDAAKHRQLATTDTGIEVQIMLPRGEFLREGAVLAESAEGIVVVRRPAEPAIVVRFGDNHGTDGARRMMLLGYLLGNQHAPIDVGGSAVFAPLLTSSKAARRMLADLGVVGEVASVAMAGNGWSRTSGSHDDHHH